MIDLPLARGTLIIPVLVVVFLILVILVLVGGHHVLPRLVMDQGYAVSET